MKFYPFSENEIWMSTIYPVDGHQWQLITLCSQIKCRRTGILRRSLKLVRFLLYMDNIFQNPEEEMLSQARLKYCIILNLLPCPFLGLLHPLVHACPCLASHKSLRQAGRKQAGRKHTEESRQDENRQEENSQEENTQKKAGRTKTDRKKTGRKKICSTLIYGDN